MQKHADITFNEHCFVLTGDICFANVMSLYAKSIPFIKEDLKRGGKIQFDFSQVHDSDSSGLALIIEWLRLADHDHTRFQFKSIPAGLLSIAKAARLESIFD